VILKDGTKLTIAALRRRWALLIRRLYQVDPLVYPRCRGVMRVVSFITQPRLSRRILKHLAGRATRRVVCVHLRPNPLSSGQERGNSGVTEKKG